MTPEQLVPTLETCKRLKEAGYRQETYLVYYLLGMKRCIVVQEHLPPADNVQGSVTAAPTLQELLEELQPCSSLVQTTDNLYNVAYSYNQLFQKLHPNPAEAAALLWLELHAEHKEQQ